MYRTVDLKSTLEHWNHIPEDKQTPENTHITRLHLKDADQAERFLAALRKDGGYGEIVEDRKTIRICDYWNPKVASILKAFNLGSILIP